MRIVFVSDTHLQHAFVVPEGDVLIHCGDGTFRGSAGEIKAWNTWFGKQPHKYKIAIAGNHEIGFEEAPDVAQRLLSDPIYLEDSGTSIAGMKFYGLPWTPWFFEWGFNFPRGPLGGEIAAQTWSRIPPDTDVLVTHGPLMGFSIGTWLANTVATISCSRPFGRLGQKCTHSVIFMARMGVYEREGTVFVNAAICDEAYRPTQSPIVLDLTKSPAILVDPL